MKYVSGDPYWTKSNKIPAHYPYLSEDLDCEVAIIGGGITGALCAYYFAQNDINTVLVDKNIIGYNSTSASTSILQYEIDQNILGLKGMFGLDNAVKSFQLCEQSLTDIRSMVSKLDCDCGFQEKDCLYYARNPADVTMLREEFALRKAHGFNVEFITSDSAKDRYSFPVWGGIYSWNSAAEIDPYRLAHCLIACSIAKGLRVYENTNIVEIKPQQDDVLLISHNRFFIRAKKVIFSTGYESTQYLDQSVAILSRTFTIVTEPVPVVKGWFDRCIIRDTDNPYIYVRSTSDNRIIFGGEDVSIGGMRSKSATLPDHYDLPERKYVILEQRLKSMFPSIGDIKIAYRFNGLFAETKDSLPYIGEYEKYPHCYFALCYGSNGILYANMASKLLLGHYLGEDPPELRLFRFNR